jgi:hypothetical protein
LIVAFLAHETRWTPETIYALTLPRLWRIMDGFRKLRDVRDGKLSEQDERLNFQMLKSMSGSMGTRTTFDRLPLAVQRFIETQTKQHKGKAN